MSKECLCKLLKAKKHTSCCVDIHSNNREGKKSLMESTHVSFKSGSISSENDGGRERPSSSLCRHAPQTNSCKEDDSGFTGITAKSACATSDSHQRPDEEYKAHLEGPWSWSEGGGTCVPSWKLSPHHPVGPGLCWVRENKDMWVNYPFKSHYSHVLYYSRATFKQPGVVFVLDYIFQFLTG